MSVEVADANGPFAQVASNNGFQDLVDASRRDSVLATFFWHAATEDTDTVAEHLEQLTGNAEVVQTAHNLAQLIRGKDFVILTRGETADIPDENGIANPEAQQKFAKILKEEMEDGAGEIHAHLTAFKALRDEGYQRKDNIWIEKQDPSVADVHINRPMGAVRYKGDRKKKGEKAKDDPGTQVVDTGNEEELALPLPLLQSNQHAHKIAKRISGSSDIDLSDQGRKLVTALGKRIYARGGLDTLQSSTLPRGIQTAELLAKENPNMKLATPSAALVPWHLGEYEGRMPRDVKEFVQAYIEHPDERPPGKGADGSKAETFNEAAKRQLEQFKQTHEDWEADPSMKVGQVVHSRGLQLLQCYVDAGAPDVDEFLKDVDVDELINPSDPDHNAFLLWRKNKIKELDPNDEDALEGGHYLILHGLTDDDHDEGNADELAEKVTKRLYLPPLEVHRAAKSAQEQGCTVDGITEPLANSSGLTVEDVKKVAEFFALNLDNILIPPYTLNAWGGPAARKWATKIISKLETVEKQGEGLMLAFWPDAETQKQLAVSGGEPADNLHVTLIYFGKPDEVNMDNLPMLQMLVSNFAATHEPLQATLGGLGRFPATPQSEGRDVVYLGVHSDEIQHFRRELVAAAQMAGFAPKNDFGFNPHLTLKYVGSHAPHLLNTPDPVPVIFDKIVLSNGAQQTEFPLTGEDEYPYFEAEGAIAKVEEDQHLVFGWASIISINGKTLTDTQGDRITNETLEEAAYDYVLEARVGGQMHEAKKAGEVKQVAKMVESCVFTKEKQQAIQSSLEDQGIHAACDLGCTGWWIGFRVTDNEVWKDIKSGKLRAFSVGGKGKRAKVAE